MLFGRLVDTLGWQCPACAELRWASQGRYRRKPARSLEGALAASLGLPDYNEPRARSPWDPRAVSDPSLVVDEFPERARGEQPSPSDEDRAPH